MEKDIDLIKNAIAQLHAQAETLELSLIETRQAISEHEIAARVLRQLGSNKLAAHKISTHKGVGVSSADPMTSIIRHCMGVLAEDSRIAVTPNEVRLFIAEKIRPDVKSGDVAPIMWRLWKKGQLNKRGDKYSLKASPHSGAKKTVDTTNINGFSDLD